MSKLILRCWDHSHKVELDIPKKKVEKFLRQCEALKKVCPECKPENKHLVPVYDESNPFLNTKAYSCSHGHLTLITPFGESAARVSVQWGQDPEQRENVDVTLEELEDLIDSKGISCNHVVDDGKGGHRVCGCKLKALDDTTLDYISVPGLKTKTRVADVWKKYGVPDPEVGDFDPVKADKDNPFMPQYRETEFEKRNKERIGEMKRKRNIAEERLPGTPISRPTKKRYKK